MTLYFTFIKGNTKTGLEFAISDKNDNSPTNLVGSTMTFGAFYPDWSYRIFSKDCPLSGLTGAISNKCAYSPNATDMITPGNYLGQLKIVFSDGKIKRIHDTVLNITEKGDLPGE